MPAAEPTMMSPVAGVGANRPPWRFAAPGLVILALTLIAYLPVMTEGGFIWDDDMYVSNNRFLQEGGHGLVQMWIPKRTPQYYPGVFTMFWIENQLWDLHPRGYHIVSVVIHALNAVLVWLLARRLKIPWAWLVGAVFALHPVHVESVAWITERKNTLSAFFYLLAALAYLRFDEDERERETASVNRWVFYIASFVCFVLALLSKSVTCSLPVALILMMLWQGRRITLKRLLPLIPFLIIGLILALNTAMLERDHVKAVGPDFAFTLADRILIASRALLFYPWKIIWPSPLIFIYPRWAIDERTMLAWWPVVLVLIIAALALWSYARGARGIPLALAFFAGTIFPALGFFNIYPMLFSFVADHFQYLASLGVIAGALGGVGWLCRAKRFEVAAACVLLPLLGAMTFRQTTHYASPEALWNATLRDNPGAWIADTNLVPVLIQRAESLRVAGQIDEAERLALQASEHAERAYRGKPNHPPVLSNLSEARRMAGDTQGAIDPLRSAIALVPDDPNYRWQLGRLLESLGQYFEAIDAYQAAAQMNPASLMFRASLAAVYARRGDFTGAQLQLDELTRIAAMDATPQPVDVMMIDRFATLLAQSGGWEQAARAEELAARLAMRCGMSGEAQTMFEQARKYRDHQPHP